jgi:hypothetical protein
MQKVYSPRKWKSFFRRGKWKMYIQTSLVTSYPRVLMVTQKSCPIGILINAGQAIVNDK